jgi:hypothetical protein
LAIPALTSQQLFERRAADFVILLKGKSAWSGHSMQEDFPFTPHQAVTFMLAETLGAPRPPKAISRLIGH